MQLSCVKAHRIRSEGVGQLPDQEFLCYVFLLLYLLTFTFSPQRLRVTVKMEKLVS